MHQWILGDTILCSPNSVLTIRIQFLAAAMLISSTIPPRNFAMFPRLMQRTLWLKFMAISRSCGSRRNALMEFGEFGNWDYTELLGHVPTRWSSFAPAIKRLLDNWPALISYFCSIDDWPARIQTMLRLKRDGTEEDNAKEVEIWLRFILSYMNVFEQSAWVIEGENVSATEVYDIICMPYEKTFVPELMASTMASNTRLPLRHWCSSHRRNLWTTCKSGLISAPTTISPNSDLAVTWFSNLWAAEGCCQMPESQW